MKRRSLPTLPPKWGVAGVAIVIAVLGARPTRAYTPESREVRAAVARAVKYLESPPQDDVGGGGDSRPGARAVVGLALFKNGARASHPKIVSAVASLQQSIDRAEDPTKIGFDIYSTALAIILFATLDPDRYRLEVNALLGYLESRQKANGAWGYQDRETGDTSMTQNALLAYWEAEKAGFTVPYGVIDRALVWLLKTRDPSGAFGYQGNESKDFTPVRQAGIRPSMAGAGLGSLYICADLLRIGKPRERKEEDLTPGMRKVEPKRARPKSRVAPQLVEQALAQGKAWMDQNFVVDQRQYQLYNLYTVERYQTFREKAEGQEQKNPEWYDEGVRYLLENQAEDGSWKDGCGQTPATAFGILFLIRSTRISVEQKETLGDGTLVGGRGLPKTTAGLALVDGNLMAKPKLASLDAALDAIGKGTSPDPAEALEALVQLPSDEAEDLATKHAQTLRELMRAAKPEVRLAAVQSLGKRRDLDNVPALLYALTDPDPVVVRAGRDSLRRISRKFDGFGMPDEPDEVAKRAAINKWRAWYLAIRPDAELED